MKTKYLIHLLLLALMVPWAATAQSLQNNTPNNNSRAFYFEDFENVSGSSNPAFPAGDMTILWMYTMKTGSSNDYWPKVCSHSSGNYQIPTNSSLSLGDRSLYMASSSSSQVGDTYAIWNGSGCLITNISFNSWREADKGTLYLGYMTDPNDVSTFHLLQTLTPPVYTSANASSALFIFDGLPIPFGAYLAFWHQADESTVRSAYLDNVRIKYISLKYHIANYASDT